MASLEVPKAGKAAAMFLLLINHMASIRLTLEGWAGIVLANRFGCDIFVEKDGEKINGKSIMGLMMLAAGPGSRITIRAEGAEAQAAVDALAELVANRFEEDR